MRSADIGIPSYTQAEYERATKEEFGKGLHGGGFTDRDEYRSPFEMSLPTEGTEASPAGPAAHEMATDRGVVNTRATSEQVEYSKPTHLSPRHRSKRLRKPRYPHQRGPVQSH